MRLLGIVLLTLALLTGCKNASVRSYWDDVPLLEDDIRVSEDRLAQFAELAVKAPQADAMAAIDALFDRLQEDDVAYYVYCDWMDGAFYSILSPCRSAMLYSKAVDRMVSDGILPSSYLDQYVQKREWIQYNQKGAISTIPVHERSLILVLDVGCPSCREALTKLASQTQWADARHIAVCCGYGTIPEIPGWEYIADTHISAMFDPKMTPLYFVVSADGTVETTYALAL